MSHLVRAALESETNGGGGQAAASGGGGDDDDDDGGGDDGGDDDDDDDDDNNDDNDDNDNVRTEHITCVFAVEHTMVDNQTPPALPLIFPRILAASCRRNQLCGCL